MEWVEVTGKTIEEAKEAALDELGVDESEAEFEVIQEPKAGLFGRLRSEARVRARVQPTAVRPKIDRSSRRRGRRDKSDAPAETRRSSSRGGGADPTGEGEPAPATEQAATGNGRPPKGGRSGGPVSTDPSAAASPTASTPAPGRRAERRPKPAAEKGDSMNDAQGPEGDGGEAAEEFLQGLVSAFGVAGTVGRTTLDDGETVEVAIEGEDVGMLIGPRGQTLAAIQELTRTVAQRRAGENQPRIVVDVAGYRKARREALERFTREVAGQVLATGVVRVLEPMPPADRKVVHDTVNTIDGVATTSEGEEPRRRVVIQPVDAG